MTGFKSLHEAHLWSKKVRAKGRFSVLILNPLKRGWANPFDHREMEN